MRTFFFGKWGDGGHHLYHQDGTKASKGEELPWTESSLDSGALDPKGSTKQGVAAVHWVRGWTAVALHDFTGDSRPGSHSVFLFEGRIELADINQAIQDHYPDLHARLHHGDNTVTVVDAFETDV